jgi:GTPase SAR1 family protein
VFSEGIEAALTAFEHRGKIREIGEWLWKRVTKGQVRVVVFGSSGAGKSTLGATLAGQEVTPDYKDSSHLETYKLEGGVPCSILVPPGQRSLRVSTWSDLMRDVSTGQSSTVLHVVSWGLNQIGNQKYTELPDHVDGMTLDATSDAYFAKQRLQEMETLESFAGQVALAPGRLSLITVVTKQDLWWENRQDVRAFYEQGRYAETIAGIRNRVGEQHFTHKIWSASLLRRNIVDVDGKVLRATAAGYDDTIQLRDHYKLLDLIHREVDHG